MSAANANAVELKGVTFITKTNQVTAMLPAAKAGS